MIKDRTEGIVSQSEMMEALGMDIGEEGGAIDVLPLRIPISGLYTTTGFSPGIMETEMNLEGIEPIPLPRPNLPILPIMAEELRLDVDGRYPLMMASGSIPLNRLQRLYWVARLKKIAANIYVGGIFYKHPTPNPFAYTEVKITVNRALPVSTRTATMVFTGRGLRDRIQTCKFRSPYFHKIEFEYDCESNIAPVTVIDTGAHPNRPPALPVENLSIETVYRRAGFDVTVNPASGTIPVGAPGGTWSDAEMHDAMQIYWSRFANVAQWAMWVFFANQHEMGHSLGGIMFDDIGPNHRQGTALFYNSFISDVAPGDPNPAAARNRLRFWTACHEMGHAVNLAHSWQKSLGVPWIPLADDPAALSFMNYPHRYPGGPNAFFAAFEYSFTRQELLFLRHAPAQFVRPGDADWFDHHGFQQLNMNPDLPLKLEVAFNRATPAFEFMEPIVAELRLTNISETPQIVDEGLFQNLDRITIAMVRRGNNARQYVPHAQYCPKSTVRVLNPGEYIATSVFLSVGLNGWDLAEPGQYCIQAALHLDEGDVVSPLIKVRIAAPRNFEEENLAQDFFTDDVGRVLAFDGSRYLNTANETLHKVVTMLGDRRVARHAAIALARPMVRNYKTLILPTVVEPVMRSLGLMGSTEEDKARKLELPRIKEEKADLTQARELLTKALIDKPDVAAETLSHIDCQYYVNTLAQVFQAEGKAKEATKLLEDTERLIAARAVKKAGR